MAKKALVPKKVPETARLAKPSIILCSGSTMYSSDLWDSRESIPNPFPLFGGVWFIIFLSLHSPYFGFGANHSTQMLSSSWQEWSNHDLLIPRNKHLNAINGSLILPRNFDEFCVHKYWNMQIAILKKMTFYLEKCLLPWNCSFFYVMIRIRIWEIFLFGLSASKIVLALWKNKALVPTVPVLNEEPCMGWEGITPMSTSRPPLP